MLKYRVREWKTVEYEMSVEEFKHYVTELRYFYGSYSGTREPEFVQLMRPSDCKGFITECATLPLGLVPRDVELGEWFEENYETVFNYLKENQQELY